MPRIANKKFKIKPGAVIITKNEAQMVGTELNKLMTEKEQELKPIDVVEYARPTNSKLHKFFDWNDSTAAEKYRKCQARNLLNSVVEVVIIKGKPAEVKSFFNVQNSEAKDVYVTLETVTYNKDYRRQLLEDANKYLENLMHTIKLLEKHI